MTAPLNGTRRITNWLALSPGIREYLRILAGLHRLDLNDAGEFHQRTTYAQLAPYLTEVNHKNNVGIECHNPTN